MRRSSLLLVVPFITACASAPVQDATAPCDEVCTIVVSNSGNVAVDVWTGGFSSSPGAQAIGTVNAGGQLQTVMGAPPRIITRSYAMANGGRAGGRCEFTGRSSDVLRYDCSTRVTTPAPGQTRIGGS